MKSCLICGCVKNCEKYLDNVFQNIKKIQEIFDKSKIIIRFDISNDFTLKKLVELKKTFDIDIIINKDPQTNIRTVNIERARNKIIDKIYNEYNEYDCFIMIDMDDVSSKPINIQVLKNAINNHSVWDGLFFNNENYYDFWALNFKDFQYSCWHTNNTQKIINIMNDEIQKEFNNQKNDFIECQSAFGGFGIYKLEKFKNCQYKSRVDLPVFADESMNKIFLKHDVLYKYNCTIYDCEHRYFHLSAINKNGSRLFIYNKNLFPPYIGEHTNILKR